MTTLVINKRTTTCDQIKEMAQSDFGVFYIQKCASDWLNLTAESARMMGKPSDSLKGAAQVFLQGAVGVTIPLAISSTIELGQAASALSKRTTPLTSRERCDFLQKMATSAQMVFHSACAFTKNALCGVIGDMWGAAEDICDAVSNGEHVYSLNQKQVQNLSSDARVYLDESKKLHSMKLIKAIIAATAGILGLLSLVFGPLVPAIALLTMITASSSLSIINRLYKMNMTYVLA